MRDQGLSLGPAIATLTGRGFAGQNIFALQGTLGVLSGATGLGFLERTLAELFLEPLFYQPRWIG